MTNTTRSLAPLPSSTEERAVWLADAGGLNTAIDAGRLGEPVALPVAEALVLGLMRQGVTKYLTIQSHHRSRRRCWRGAGAPERRTPP